jgi:UDP-N-acetylglucosamine 2-epimerase
MQFIDFIAFCLNRHRWILMNNKTSDGDLLIFQITEYANFNALNIRETHERPEAMEEASVMMVGLNPERIMQCLVQVKKQKRGIDRNFKQVLDYSIPNVSEKMVRIILSYTDYVNRIVWNKK